MSGKQILVKNLLSNQSDTGDIPFRTPTVATTSLPFPQITETEVTHVTLGKGNNAPGKDGIPTALIRFAWPHISAFVFVTV